MARETVSVPANTIMSALRQTPAGESLLSTYRWSTFRTNETDEDWREMLGATAIDFSHGELMYRIGCEFLDREKGRFSPEQEELLLCGLLVHDYGEAVIDGNGVGDVSAQVKTSEHEKAEVVIAKVVIASLPIEDELKVKLIQSYEHVVEGGDPDIHKAFKAMEKTEYVMTALKAYLSCRRRESEGRSGIENEMAMVGRVIVIDLAKVLDLYAVDYPNSIGQYVKSMERVIDEAYQYTKPWLQVNSWRTTPDHKALCDAFDAKWEKFKKNGK